MITFPDEAELVAFLRENDLDRFIPSHDVRWRTQRMSVASRRGSV